MTYANRQKLQAGILALLEEKQRRTGVSSKELLAEALNLQEWVNSQIAGGQNPPPAPTIQ